MKEKLSKKKKLIIALSAVGAFVAALFVFLMVWYFGASYPAYKKIAKNSFSVPGLKEGISPQGLCALPAGCGEYDFAMSGYMVDKSSSRVYLIDEETSACKYITLTRNGKAVTSHFGGVTASENYLFIADGKKIARVPLADALQAENGAALPVFDEFETDINNAYCYYYSNAATGEKTLFVGEFYREQNYKTADSHHLTENGETNYAFIYAFSADENGTGGVASTTPYAALSVRGLVQGVAVDEAHVYLSTSYGLPDSHLYVYPNVLKSGAASGSATVKEASVPVYRLDSKNLQSTLTMPCMSEEICISDGRVYVLYESLCNKYKAFTRTRKKEVDYIAIGDLVKG